MLPQKYLLVVGGPTASGKTALAIQLAQRYRTVILSADSRQFFREMSIGTAKPSPTERAAAPHYFIDSHSTVQGPLQTDFAFLEFGKNNQNDPFWLAYRELEPQVEQIDSTSTGWISANFADWELDAEFDMTFETMFLPTRPRSTTSISARTSVSPSTKHSTSASKATSTTTATSMSTTSTSCSPISVTRPTTSPATASPTPPTSRP